jgi:hypothetical protein
MRKFLKAKIVSLVMCGTAWAFSPSPTQQFAHAIAKAEGFYRAGTIPNRLHNPGDIRALRGTRYPGQVGLNKHGYVIFRNDRAGWQALYHQIDKIIAGESTHYNVDMTLRQLSRKYATSSTWVKNVSRTLGVTPDARVWEVLNVAPRVEGVLSAETPIYCRPDVIKAMNFIWTESRNGTTGVEATFILNGMPSAYSIEQESMTDEKMQQTVHVYPGQTFALFHVHPNGGGMYPSTPTNNYAGNDLGDTGFADKYGFDIYVVSYLGLTVYRPNGQVTVKLRDNMSWTSTKGCF